jgi:hypothetical protein
MPFRSCPTGAAQRAEEAHKRFLRFSLRPRSSGFRTVAMLDPFNPTEDEEADYKA